MFKLRSLVGALALAAVLSPAAHAASSDKTFTVTNTGNGMLTLTGPAISGNTGEYTLLPGHSCTTVGAGNSCAMTVRFTPIGTGARAAASLDFASSGTSGPAHSIALSGSGRHPTSCKDLLAAAPASPSGTYAIAPDGTSAPFSAYCDMTSNGGGWTMVVRQYEGSPVAWTGGAEGNSFTLAQAKIPAHTQVGFGKDTAATYVDYVNFHYTTGDIPVSLVTGLKTGLNYQIHRNTAYYYDFHNPEENVNATAEVWRNTLTFDRTGGQGFDWAFARSNPVASEQGYAMTGNVKATADSFAWTVWVR